MPLTAVEEIAIRKAIADLVEVITAIVIPDQVGRLLGSLRLEERIHGLEEEEAVCLLLWRGPGIPRNEFDMAISGGNRGHRQEKTAQSEEDPEMHDWNALDYYYFSARIIPGSRGFTAYSFCPLEAS